MGTSSALAYPPHHLPGNLQRPRQNQIIPARDPKQRGGGNEKIMTLMLMMTMMLVMMVMMLMLVMMMMLTMMMMIMMMMMVMLMMMMMMMMLMMVRGR